MTSSMQLKSTLSAILVSGLLMAISSGLQAADLSQNYIVDHDFEGVDPGSIAEWEGWWKVMQKDESDDEWCEPVNCQERLKTVRRGTTGQHVLELPGLEHCCFGDMGDNYTYEAWPCDFVVEQDRLWPWFDMPGFPGGEIEGPFTDTQPTAFQLVELSGDGCIGTQLTLRFDYIAPASPADGYVYVLHTGIMTHEAGAAEDDWQYPSSVAIPASSDWRTAEVSIDREGDWDAAVVFFRYRYVPCAYTDIYKDEPHPAYCICRCDKACSTPEFDACHFAEVTGVLVDDVYLFEASTETGLVTHDYPYEEASPGGLGGDEEFFPDPRIEAYRPGGEKEIIERLTDVEMPVKRLESESFMELVGTPQIEVCATTCTSASPPDNPCSGNIVSEDRPYEPSSQLESYCAADFNNDGWVNGQDLTTLLGDWGQADSIADINCDGIIDGSDLSILLGYWGPCSPTAGLIAPPNL